MPRKTSNNPLFTKRTVLKRSSMRGRGIKQKDLVADTGGANPTEPIQVRQEQPAQDVMPYVPTMGNSVLNALPPNIPTPPYPYPSSSQPMNFASDDYAPPQVYWNENVPAPTIPLDTVESPPPIPSKYDSKDYSFDITDGSTPPAFKTVSEATSRFFNQLNEFFGVLGNTNK